MDSKDLTLTKLTFTANVVETKSVVRGGNTGSSLHHLNRKHLLEYEECMVIRSVSTSNADEMSK